MVAPIAFLLPKEGSTFSNDVDGLFNFITGLTAVFFVGIIVSCVYFVIRYRQRGHEMGDPKAPTHHTVLELIWSGIPFVLCMALFWLGFVGFINMISSPQNAYDIIVNAGGYKWRFYYPEVGGESEELVIPVGRPVRLTMNSSDFIHSFYVPEFRVKQDVVPGRYTKMWFQTTTVGEYTAYCAEYCGVGHSTMMAHVSVIKESDFTEWLKTINIDTTGEKTYKLYCSSCHTNDGSTLTGPTFKGLYGKSETVAVRGGGETQVEVNDDYIRESILDPQAKIVKGFNPVMNTFKGTLNDEKIALLTSYIKSLK